MRLPHAYETFYLWNLFLNNAILSDHKNTLKQRCPKSGAWAICVPWNDFDQPLLSTSQEEYKFGQPNRKQLMTSPHLFCLSCKQNLKKKREKKSQYTHFYILIIFSVYQLFWQRLKVWTLKSEFIKWKSNGKSPQNGWYNMSVFTSHSQFQAQNWFLITENWDIQWCYIKSKLLWVFTSVEQGSTSVKVSILKWEPLSQMFVFNLLTFIWWTFEIFLVFRAEHKELKLIKTPSEICSNRKKELYNRWELILHLKTKNLLLPTITSQFFYWNFRYKFQWVELSISIFAKLK